MDAQQSNMEDFGFQFLGPICTSYFSRLNTLVESKPNSCVLFLAREGYFFQQTFEHLQARSLAPHVEHHYLLASRTFLFRMTIDHPQSWDMSLGHGFDGTYQQLLVARFGFSPSTVKGIFDADILEQALSLPQDISEVKATLALHKPELTRSITQSRMAYFDYLKQFDLSRFDDLILVDVGYSGTIQKLLTLLLKKDTFGLYFITTEQGEHVVKDNIASMLPVFKNGVKMGDGYTMLDRSLFLEALLTSPNGQFLDVQRSAIVDNTTPFRFFYGRRSYAQEHFLELSAIFDGAIEAITENLAAKVNFSTEEIESLYQVYTSSRLMIPSAIWPLFDVDDAISGNANVNPMHLFRI